MRFTKESLVGLIDDRSRAKRTTAKLGFGASKDGAVDLVGTRVDGQSTIDDVVMLTSQMMKSRNPLKPAGLLVKTLSGCNDMAVLRVARVFDRITALVRTFGKAEARIRIEVGKIMLLMSSESMNIVFFDRVCIKFAVDMLSLRDYEGVETGVKILGNLRTIIPSCIDIDLDVIQNIEKLCSDSEDYSPIATLMEIVRSQVGKVAPETVEAFASMHAFHLVVDALHDRKRFALNLEIFTAIAREWNCIKLESDELTMWLAALCNFVQENETALELSTYETIIPFLTDIMSRTEGKTSWYAAFMVGKYAVLKHVRVDKEFVVEIIDDWLSHTITPTVHRHVQGLRDLLTAQ